MAFIKDKRSGRLHAVCDACGYRSRYPRRDDDDVPRDWGGSKRYLRCSHCEWEWSEVQSEQLANQAYHLR